MIYDLQKRMDKIDSLKEENEDSITVYVEIQLNRNQVKKLDERIGIGGIELFDYYKNKIDNKLVLKHHHSGSTAVEDNCDFQEIIDDYIESIK